MKVFQSSVVRALCAIIVGALIVKYRELTVTWITIAIGVLFFMSGVFSCVTYFIARGKKNDVQMFDYATLYAATQLVQFDGVGQFHNSIDNHGPAYNE